MLLARTEIFGKKIIYHINKNLVVSKVENENFHFTGMYVKKTNEGIEVSMEQYVRSIEEIKDIRKGNLNDPLRKAEQKMYRKYTGKIAWLALNTISDLSVTSHLMLKKNNSAVIKDMKRINHVFKKIREKENKVKFTKVGSRDELMLYGIGDASYKSDGSSVLVGSRRSEDVNTIYWKMKVFYKVCHLPKAMETRNISKLVDCAVSLLVS